ncbi:unnamed protein product [Hermetia illucens]|uniref:Kazal-like domain-containing protein n=1 Tax=Hermetia illucens TaxID=343691 RepID=A0A7R8YQF7_HERIL|nr:unnamed protein product [Hermetia illucens]
MMDLKILVFIFGFFAFVTSDSWRCPDPSRCPSAYMPVCVDYKGFRKQFHNQCALDLYNCKNKLNLRGSRTLCPQNVENTFGFFFENI